MNRLAPYAAPRRGPPRKTQISPVPWVTVKPSEIRRNSDPRSPSKASPYQQENRKKDEGDDGDTLAPLSRGHPRKMAWADNEVPKDPPTPSRQVPEATPRQPRLARKEFGHHSAPSTVRSSRGPEQKQRAAGQNSFETERLSRELQVVVEEKSKLERTLHNLTTSQSGNLGQVVKELRRMKSQLILKVATTPTPTHPPSLL